MVFKLSTHCPYCHRYTYISDAKSSEDIRRRCVWVDEVSKKTWWMGICNNCNNPVLVLNDGQKIYPTPLPKPTDIRIPEIIRNDLDEAKICFSVNAYRACAVMARRALQVCCIDKGANKDNLLVNQIEELFNQGIITKDIKDWATAIRWVGNDGAHPNADFVNQEDARDILDLVEQFLQVVYVAPEIAKARLERKKK